MYNIIIFAIGLLLIGDYMVITHVIVVVLVRTYTYLCSVYINSAVPICL